MTGWGLRGPSDQEYQEFQIISGQILVFLVGHRFRAIGSAQPTRLCRLAAISYFNFKPDSTSGATLPGRGFLVRLHWV